MATIEELAERVERLLVRHEELRRTNVLLTSELATVRTERDQLRSRLVAARGRIDMLLQRLPRDPATEGASAEPARVEPLRSVG